MKKTILGRSLLNALLYTLIACAVYYLYSPFNDHPNNKTSSSVQFVYQQF